MQYGVPQGSILGPLLFIIYINDIPNFSQIAKFILYADDTNIIITGNNITEVNAQLRDLCKILLKWVDSNGLCLNLKKTKYMIFSRSRNLELLSTLKIANLPIERLTESKFLGVIVDENLTWSWHIKTIQTKMARYIGLMYKLKIQLPLLKVRIQIFHSFVQSHINYCSLVWGFSAKTNIDSLFRGGGGGGSGTKLQIQGRLYCILDFCKSETHHPVFWYLGTIQFWPKICDTHPNFRLNFIIPTQNYVFYFHGLNKTQNL